MPPVSCSGLRSTTFDHLRSLRLSPFAFTQGAASHKSRFAGPHLARAAAEAEGTRSGLEIGVSPSLGPVEDGYVGMDGMDIIRLKAFPSVMGHPQLGIILMDA